MSPQNMNTSLHDNNFKDNDISQEKSEILLKDMYDSDEEKVDISEYEGNDCSQDDCYVPSTGADANSSLDDEEDIKVTCD